MRTTRKFVPPSELASYPPQCSVCGGPVAERAVTLSLPDADGKIRLVRGVPAGVCENCGEQYLTSAVIREIERLLENPPTRHEETPIWDFVAGA